MLTFVADNTWTQIFNCDHFALKVFDRELSYPTRIAEAKDNPYASWAQSTNWDGWIHLLRMPRTKPPWFPSGLLPKILRICRKMRIAYSVDDRRRRPVTGFPDFPEVPLRDYQEEAVEKAVAAGMGVIHSSPRSGKTRVFIEIIRRLGLPALWVAPTDRIADQTRGAIAEFFGDEYVVHLTGAGGQRRAETRRVVVCTAATATLLDEEFYRSREVIAVDEVHHAAAKSYHQGIFPKCGHIYFRFGMTGTFFRSDTDELALHAFLSDTIYRIESDELVRRGYLVPTSVVFLPVKTKRLRNMPSSTYQAGHGKYGIHENHDRQRLVTWAATMLSHTGRKVLILVGTKRQGRELQRQISAFIRPPPGRTEFQPVEFLSTDVPRPTQRRAIEAFLESDEVKVLVGTSLLGEGVDLPTADALVYAKGEKAEVSLVQNAFRVSTAVPGKSRAIIVDFADRHNAKLMAHSRERLAIYHREKTFDVEVLEDPAELTRWVQRVDGGVQEAALGR